MVHLQSSLVDKSHGITKEYPSKTKTKTHNSLQSRTEQEEEKMIDKTM